MVHARMVHLPGQSIYVNMCEEMMSANSVLDAAYLTAQDYPGGASALAMRMVQKPAVLSHKLNPNDNANHLTVRDLITIMVMTGDHRALHSLNVEMGYLALPMPSADEETSTEAIMKTCNQFAEYLKSVTDALADGRVTKLELRTEREKLSALIAQAGKLDAALAAKESRGSPRK